MLSPRQLEVLIPLDEEADSLLPLMMKAGPTSWHPSEDLHGGDHLHSEKDLILVPHAHLAAPHLNRGKAHLNS